MSHHDKKFDDESQDARRHDQHEKVHPNEKPDEHKVKSHKDKYLREERKK